MDMLLTLHVLIALGSLIFSGLMLFGPSAAKVKVSYGLVALTLVSGLLLIVISDAPMLRTCYSGLLYLAVILPLIQVARHRAANYTNS